MTVFNSMRMAAAFTALFICAIAATHVSAQPIKPQLQALWALSESAYDAGNYGAAESAARRAIALATGRFGPDHPGVSRGLHHLGLVYMRMGRPKETEQLARRALAIRVRERGAISVPAALSYNLLGWALLLQERFDEAEPAIKRAIAIMERVRGNRPHQKGNVYRTLAVLYAHQWRLAESEKYYKLAMAELERSTGRDSVWTLRAVRNYATLLARMGRVRESETAYKRAIAGLETRTTREHSELVQALGLFAGLLMDLDRFDEADAIYRRALAAHRQTSHRHKGMHATALSGYGMLHSERGQHQEAEKLLREAVTLNEGSASPEQIELAENRLQLGLVLYRTGRFEEALSLTQNAAGIFRRLLGASSAQLGRAKVQLGSILTAAGRRDEGDAAFASGLSMSEQVLGPEHPRLAYALRSRAEGYETTRQPTEAVAMLERASSTLARLQQSGEGLALSTTSSEYRPRLRRAIHTRLLDLSWTSTVTSGQPPDNHVALERGFHAAQRAADTSTSLAVAQMSLRFSAGDSPLALLLRQAQDLSLRARSLDNELLMKLGHGLADEERGSGRDRAMLQKEIARIGSELGRLDARLKAEFPSYFELTRAGALSLVETQQLLADDEALVKIFVGEHTSYVWAITRTGADWHRLNLPSSKLGEAVEKLRCGLEVVAWTEPTRNARCKALGLELQQQGVLPFDLAVAHQLYVDLLAPLRQIISGKRLIVVASGPLTSLPMHVMVTSPPDTALPPAEAYGDAAWLVRRHAISIMPSVPSLRAVRKTATQPAAAKPLIGYGDPQFQSQGALPPIPGNRSRSSARSAEATKATSRGRSPTVPLNAAPVSGARINLAEIGKGLQPLPETSTELRQVAERVGASQADILLGSQASETSVKRAALDSYRIIYFATHGLVADEVGGLSEPALALTPPAAPTDQDDGLLTASEVTQLKLNADWVVLSACNTAAGARPGAEPLSGLARAFFYAGARALLVSHWRVYSDAAFKLSAGIFSELAAAQGIGRDEALRRSMLALLDRGDDETAQPAYWAPFVVVGDGR
jgi:CHAT domain-containing protein/tetratricopeptide (TPR) repeat protein